MLSRYVHHRQAFLGGMLLLLAAAGVSPAGATESDPVDKVLKQGNISDPQNIEYVRKLVEGNPQHPRILELRLYYLSQLMGTDDADQLHAVIRQFERLAEDAGQQNAISFDCQMRIGIILEHLLRDAEAAYEHYKSLETHPSLNGSDIETDYRKTDLYCRIAQVARSHQLRKYDEAERYARLVMAYPYLGMENREMYQRFYELYEQAGNILLSLFQDDLKKLADLEIYPSHPALYTRRQEYIRRAVGVAPVADPISEMGMTDDSLSGQRLASDPNGGDNVRSRSLPVAQTGKEIAPTQEKAGQTRSAYGWAVLCLGIICVSLAGGLVAMRRHRRNLPRER